MCPLPSSPGEAAPAPLRVLACVADSPHAGVIVSEAAAIARTLSAELELLHVAPAAEATQARLQAILRDHGLEPGAYPLAVRDGRPAHVIRAQARQGLIDLIVMGANEREGLLDSLMMGSIARRVALTAPCSVLLLSQGQAPARTGFREVVVATRLDDYSRQMLALISRTARQVGTQTLHVVRELSVLELRALEYDIGSPRELEQHQRRLLFEMNEALLNFIEPIDFGELKLRVHCLEAGEGVGAMDYARGHGADLLVYPAPPRPLSLLHRFFDNRRSVVLQQIPCALLFYRPSPHRPRVAP
ncbi:MAG: Universal stress protein family protein [candidate division BRC1 bacterium ADurb.BinA292]|nr:MAG: Universal stress protein family protein [candidate division BRC1 bacterium ADurb.BinA292]